MREIRNDDLSWINKKVGKLSVDLARGNIRNAKELAKTVENALSQEELVFAITVLIIERYTKISNEFVKTLVKEKTNNETMYR